MTIRVFVALALVALAVPALADDGSPVFGSSTQKPVVVVIDGKTGLPVASADLPKPVVASTQ